MGRTATGVRAIKLDEDGKDHAIGMVCVDSKGEETILVISEKGFGKRTALDDENGEPIYRITNRGGKGVKTIALTEKTGSLVGLHAVNDDEDLMLITKSGTAIRMAMDSIRVQGRATQGVKLIELQKRNDTLMFGCVVPKDEDEEMSAAEQPTDAAELPNEPGQEPLNEETNNE
jgi:DNA gyrase subunit A